jgi:DNA-directed RNA polymerase subunit omega
MARVSIEDCLDHIENRFALVMVAAHRTRQLLNGKDALLRTKNKEAVTALREIAEGLVVARQASGNKSTHSES